MKKLNTDYEVGFRAIKSAIAVFFCLLISFILKRHSAFYSSIAAIVCMQQTHHKTAKIGRNRIIGTVMGGVAGYGIIEAAAFIPGYNKIWYLIITPVAVLGLISLCNVIHKKEASAMCCIVFLSIVLNVDRGVAEALPYVVNRIIDTSIGIIIAIIVNRYIFPNTNDNKEQ